MITSFFSYPIGPNSIVYYNDGEPNDSLQGKKYYYLQCN